MNEYLKAFQLIAQSAEKLVAVENNSLEIKESAKNLHQSIQPCIQELRQSATRLQNLVEGCFHDLEYAEDVWNSKPRIVAAPREEIWEQLGELSGRHLRIQQLSEQCKEESIKQAKKYWEDKVEILRKTWFIDKSGKIKAGIGWSDKEGFIKGMRSEIDTRFPLPKLSTIISNSLILIHQEINLIKLNLILECVKLLDRQSQTSLSKKIELILKEIEGKFANYEDNTNKIIREVKDNGKYHLVSWEKKFGDVTWTEVVVCKNKIWSNIEHGINLVFDERVNLVTQAIDEAIAFYSDFLAKQERYQQETPEQREAEKVWIKQQREELQRVKQGLEETLNQFSN
ncbi:hypothetical protein NIES2119_01040 [[Phormidium ambiguum] IAM M-71]|uniref:Uncharacterized protein n=1 Tax=[Phormidium ambiguum] IAM M-71 TaxID=454136 RepID=A0A1U7ITW8_9CYAN|nr:hypothetical protein [Phormidium ambiguum]OKH40925.1 hypothetical protein NIES2119_01040 [Phormidium ambiguum IAM M-71]